MDLTGVAVVFHKPARIRLSLLMVCPQQRNALPIENLQFAMDAMKTLEATLVGTQIYIRA